MSGFVISGIVHAVALGAFFLSIAYELYALLKGTIAEACLTWQRKAIDRHLAQHGLSHDQVLPTLMQLEFFSIECGGEIWVFRRGENSSFTLLPKTGQQSTLTEQE